MITCLVIAQLYFAVDMREYSVHTEWYPKIMTIVETENIDMDEEKFRWLFGERIPFVESSLGVKSQLYGDDNTSFGAYQNQIKWSLMRRYPLGWTEMDSLAMVLELVTDPYASQREFQETFYEHMRYWKNKYGKTGDRLLYLTIRSTNRGLDYYDAMDRLGDRYIEAVLPEYGRGMRNN